MNEFIKNLCRRLNIQFRKIDPRRSENIVLGINYDCLKEQKKILISYMDYGRTAYSIRHTISHTNLQEMFQLIKVLIDMDFALMFVGAIMKMQQQKFRQIIMIIFWVLEICFDWRKREIRKLIRLSI